MTGVHAQVVDLMLFSGSSGGQNFTRCPEYSACFAGVHYIGFHMSLQQNVQQQNEGTFEAMLATAKHFREGGVPVGIQEFLAKRGIELSTSAIVRVQAEGYMLGFEFGLGGLLVTQDHRFIEFELELDATLNRVVAVHGFSDVTELQDTSHHNRGTGKGVGALAIEVVEALNEM